MNLAQNDIIELINLLNEGEIIPGHLPTQCLVDQALITGDYRSLTGYLERYPLLLNQARQNIRIKQYNHLNNPFDLVSRAEAQEYFSGPLKLGYVNKNDDQFGIIPSLLAMILLIIGPVGGGKSNLLKYMLIQCANLGGGFNIIIPDLKREYRQLIHHFHQLWILSNESLRINPLHKPDWLSFEIFIPWFAKIFTKANFLVGTSLNTLIETIDRLYRKHGIYAGSNNWPTMGDLYKEITAQLNKHSSFRFRDILLWLLNRLYPYSTHQIFNCRTGINEQFWREKNIVIELGLGVSDNMYSFLVSYTVGLRFLYNQIHGLTGQRLNTLYLFDESRILLDANRNVMDFGESYITETITKSREYGLGFVFASHEAASINPTLRSLAHTKIAYRLSDKDDVEFIEKSFGLNEDQRDYIYKIDRKGIAITNFGGFNRPFLLGTPYVDLGPQISDDQVAQHMAPILSQLKSDIQIPAHVTAAVQKNPFPSAAKHLLVFLDKNPFVKVSDISKATDQSVAMVQKTLTWLEKNNYIKREAHKVSKKGRKAHFSVLTNKAHTEFGFKPIPGHGSFLHKLYQHLVCKKLNNIGLKARIESRIKGTNKSIDVLCRDEHGQIIAYEITLHHENINENVTKDIAAGASQVVLVCRNPADLNKARNIVWGKLHEMKNQEKVQFSLISEFFN